VSRAEVCLEEQKIAVCFHFTQFGHPLGGLPVGHTGIMQTCGYQQGGIALPQHILMMIVASIAYYVCNDNDGVIDEVFAINGTLPVYND
jgi:hypothetical protein